jgi:excinuclease ABC subunit B
MAKPPNKPKKDPTRPTRAKAARPDAPKPDSALDALLNPGIAKGTAGLGSGTGLQQPPDNSFDRRRDFSEAHRARKSAQGGFEEAPQSDYTGAPVTGLDPALAKELGLGDGNDASTPSEDDREKAIKDALVARAGGDPKFRLPRADLPTGPGGLASMGVTATADALEKLLREGRAETETGHVWTPHRPPRPEKSEGGQKFVIKSEFEPKGDQPVAIRELVEGVKRNDRTQVLLGVTGSGKTFTMAKVIEATQRPALSLRAE